MSVADVIVLGLGGVGSQAALALARRGARVLGLEQHALVHALGSSHGETRIIRKAYFEHPDYVPLLKRAYAGWDRLEAERGERLFERTGLLFVGPPEGEVIAGTRRAAAEHALPLEELDGAELPRRWPGMRPYEGALGLLERDAGLLYVERCVGAALAGARALGADLRAGEAALDWEATSSGVRVRTGAGEHHAAALVVCAGAWAGRMLPTLRGALQPQRKVQLWLSCQEPSLALGAGFPTWGVQEPDGSFFYGFPSLEAGSLKLAEHGPGAEVADPSALDRELHPDDLTRVADFAARRLRGVTPPALKHAPCMYTMSPDGHFVLDRLPGHDNVVLAAGLSGHGFKLATALGEILAELALDGRSTSEIGFLSATRPALSRPALSRPALSR